MITNHVFLSLSSTPFCQPICVVVVVAYLATVSLLCDAFQMTISPFSLDGPTCLPASLHIPCVRCEFFISVFLCSCDSRLSGIILVSR
jgi:hypothetical protein